MTSRMIVRPAAIGANIRVAACLAVLALLAACSGNRSQISASQEAAQYAARAKRDYRPPGPPGDPWGPYIVEASGKYDVPEKWVREVMRQESGGRLYENGQLITSSPGAMGLMQVMPATWDELKVRYGLGDDPYEPHDNVMAGTAYIREMYDLYGSPGFLAAYNAGPGRLDDYLSKNRGLPEETRKYVARVGAAIGDTQPVRLSSAADSLQIPVNIPNGPRYPHSKTGAPVMLADNRNSRSTGYDRGPITASSLPMPPPLAPTAPVQMAQAQTRPASKGGFHLIAPAYADTMPTARTPVTGAAASGGWAVQVGAFASEGLARAAADAARSKAHEQLGGSKPFIGPVKQASNTLYRARLTGLSRDAAMQACEKLSHSHSGCIVISPNAQS